MNNQLKKITARAKKIRKAKPGMKWTSAIKQASRDYRTGKLGSAKPARWQTGSSTKKYDEQRKAKKPGKRKTAHGTVYTERRKDRSDMPGKLTGVSTASLASELKKRKREQLAKALLAKDQATNRRSWIHAGNRVKALKKDLNKLQ